MATVLHRLPRLDRVVDWATKVDNDRRLGLVVIAADTGQLIAHAGLERDPGQPDRAEFAVVIADRYQRCELGGMLLGQLAEAPREVGIRWLTGEMLANNHRMVTCIATRDGSSGSARAVGGPGGAANLVLPERR